MDDRFQTTLRRFLFGGRFGSLGALVPAALLLLASLEAWETEGGRAQDAADVHFRWAFATVAEDGSVAAVEPRQVLHSGDRVKFMVELTGHGFVYVIHVDPRGDVSLVFPHPRDLYRHDVSGLVLRRFFVPPGSDWFVLDESTGQEIVHLLGSPRRLEGLERLVDDYERAGEGERAERGSEVLAEIRRLRRQHWSAQTPAERPALIGGSVRGVPSNEDVASVAVEIVAREFYSKTFVIDHR